MFHEDATTVREHDGAYNRPGMNELCVVANNLELGYPPIIVQHRLRQLPDGRPMLDIIHNYHPIYNRLHFFYFSQVGDKVGAEIWAEIMEMAG